MRRKKVKIGKSSCPPLLGLFPAAPAGIRPLILRGRFRMIRIGNADQGAAVFQNTMRLAQGRPRPE